MLYMHLKHYMNNKDSKFITHEDNDNINENNKNICVYAVSNPGWIVHDHIGLDDKSRKYNHKMILFLSISLLLTICLHVYTSSKTYMN